MSSFVTNLDIFIALKTSGKINNSDFLYKMFVDRITEKIYVEDVNVLKRFTRNYTSNLCKRWSKANRCQKTFFKYNFGWLESDIVWPFCESINLMSIFSERNMDTGEEEEHLDVEQLDSLLDVVKAGPSSGVASTNTPIYRKSFENLSNKQKKRRSETLIEHSEEELLFGLITKLRENRNVQLANIFNALSKDNVKTKKVHDFLFKNEPQISLPIDETLALVTALKLSKWQYTTLRRTLSDTGVTAFPSYAKLLPAKVSCYPNTNDMAATEIGVRIKLQAVLDLTVTKILKVIGTHIDSHSLKLISKWGCDGSSSHSTYKQKHNTSEYFSDSSVFMISFVPLQLMCGEVIIWENPRPSSTNYCRPIMFEFVKETKEYIQQQTATMNEEIANLIPTKIGELKIFHELHMTMIDGKVSTALSQAQSHANCNICLASPKEMNDLSLLSTKTVAEDMYKYGLSSFHMWLRCMVCILHISYNMDFKKWSARGHDKLLQKSRKELTQQELFKQTGLLVDIVKQGFGTTNDGNTARRFFRDYEKSSEITGVDKSLIKRFAVILQAISSGKNVNIEHFKEYCNETAELYVHLYPWYYMPASIHKLLLHGADICQHFSFIPVGMLSEEASEARNKDFRNIRERHSRKIGRKETNEDIVHNFLISSDPYITHIKPKFERKKKDIFPEISYLLSENEIDTEEDEEINLEYCPTTDPLGY